MEHFVANASHPLFLGAYVWLTLVRVWAALRADDVQGLLPETVKIFKKGHAGNAQPSRDFWPRQEDPVDENRH
eukprot:10297328-Karenia_brevis.AAC.1